MKESIKHSWTNQIISSVETAGFSSLTELLLAFPCDSYSSINNRLNDTFAPIQIIIAQYQEAMKTGNVRLAARDALCRTIYEEFPHGWGLGENHEFKEAKLLSGWATELTVTAGLKTLEDFAHTLVENFKAPKYWKPIGPNDPIIIDVFDKYWPT